MKIVKKYMEYFLYALFLPTWLIYVINGYLAGFSEKIYMIITTVTLSFIVDVMWGKGLFFLLYGSLLIYAELFNSSMMRSISIYMLFSVLWFFVLWARGFPLWFTFAVAMLWLWEVFSYERGKRVLY